MDQLGNPLQQLVVPTKHRRSIIDMAHAVPMSGHIGGRCAAYKTFYWPGLVKQVLDVC